MYQLSSFNSWAGNFISYKIPPVFPLIDHYQSVIYQFHALEALLSSNRT